MSEIEIIKTTASLYQRSIKISKDAIGYIVKGDLGKLGEIGIMGPNISLKEVV